MSTTPKFKAQAAEARSSSESLPVKYKGHTYKILPQDEWTIDMLEAFHDAEDNPIKIVSAFREMLGKAQYGAFKQRHNKMSDMVDFFEAWKLAMERKHGSAPNS